MSGEGGAWPDEEWLRRRRPARRWSGGGAPGAAWPGGGDPPGVKAASAGVFAMAAAREEGLDFNGGFLFLFDRSDSKAQRHGG